MDEKKSEQVGKQPDSVLEGKIPGSEESVYFTEEKVDDKGDCGFIGLGCDRNKVADELLGLADAEDFRAQLWQEIFEAFETHRLERTPEFENLFNSFQESNLSHEIYEQRRQALEEYCTRKEVYELYVNAYRGKLWLGYKSALLFAFSQEMTVYIWKKDTANTISILDSEVSKNPTRIVHMLLTRGYTHYNLLVEAPKPEYLHITSKAVIKFDGKDFYSVIDKLEKPILDSVKSYGYSSIEKKDDARKLMKDDGSCIEIAKSGEMNALINLNGNPDAVAKACAKIFIAMIMIYYEIAKEMGKEKTFSAKSLDMNIEKVSAEVNGLVKMHVKRELAKSPLDAINDKFTYDGETLFPGSAKADTKGHSPTLLKPPKEMRDNVNHGLKENNDTSNSIPSDNQHHIQQRSGRTR